jgi:hypothetical protein
MSVSKYAIAVALTASCATDPSHQITIVDGPTTTHFSLRSAFAEYVELPGDRNELRLTLASYPISCERWIAPPPGETALTVIVALPPETRPLPGAYPWNGMPAPGDALKAPYALPKALFGGTSRLFEPGGEVKLSSVDVEPRGTITGHLAFEFPGVGDRPTTRIEGSFDAKTCRSVLASH